MENIEYSLFQSFREMITIEKIRNFPYDCLNYQNEHHLKENSNKITKNIFISIFQKIFSSNPIYNNLYELFFNRFKNNKCIFKTEKNKENYTLCDIISTEDIDIYNIEIALIVFHKCDFFQKIKILFEITDSDDDGLINENEVKKIIFTINNLFPRDVSLLKTNSNLISQSLSNIFASKIYNLIMYLPGGLMNIINKEKCINFETFFKSIIKIKDYKYKIMPLYVNIKECLLEKKKEMEFDMNETVSKDFISVTYDLINQSILNIYDEQKVKIKNILDPKIVIKKKKKDPITQFKEKKVKQEIERENKIKYLQNPKFFGLKKSISMNIEKLMKNKLNKIKKNSNKTVSPFLSSTLSSLNVNNKSNNNSVLKNKRNTSQKNFLSTMKSFNRTNSINLNLTKNLSEKIIKRDNDFYNLSSSNLNDFTENSNNNLNNLITEKVNYDKLVNIQFPPCKINITKSSFYYPKLILKKSKTSLINSNNNNSLLKSKYEIKEDINKVLRQYNNFEGDYNNNMNDIMKRINNKRKKYINKNIENISPNFFKFQYMPIKSSRNFYI